jgi:hypothetical protein
MPKLIVKCGIDCSACTWGINWRNGLSTEKIEEYRNNAKMILGYMPIRKLCLTCQTSDSEISKGSKLPNQKCLIHQCVDNNGLENCVYCSSFPCNTVEETGGIWT